LITGADILQKAKTQNRDYSTDARGKIQEENGHPMNLLFKMNNLQREFILSDYKESEHFGHYLKLHF